MKFTSIFFAASASIFEIYLKDRNKRTKTSHTLLCKCSNSHTPRLYYMALPTSFIKEPASSNSVTEYQSLRVIYAIAKVYRSTDPYARQIVRDIRHIVAAYKLCDRETALACNQYIVAKYPSIYDSAIQYGLHRMSEQEMLHRSEPQLQHMLYCLCVFLYDNLRTANT